MPSNQVLSSHAFYNQLNDHLRQLKLSVDRKADQLIHSINTGEQIFNSGINKLSNEVNLIKYKNYSELGNASMFPFD